MGQNQAATKIRTETGAADDVAIIEHIGLVPPSAVGITQAGADRASHVGLVLLILLNVVDIALTRRFLAFGLEEGNPLMAVAVRSWAAAACKVAILAGLAWSFAKRPATATRLVLVWTGVGLYLLAAYVNVGAIQAAELARR